MCLHDGAAEDHVLPMSHQLARGYLLLVLIKQVLAGAFLGLSEGRSCALVRQDAERPLLEHLHVVFLAEGL